MSEHSQTPQDHLSVPKDKKKLCDVCFANPSKYKCPACGVVTCSLTCVKKHKLQFECSGKEDNTKFIPMAKLKEDAEVLVQRDYNFLLNFGRQIDLTKTDTFKAAKPIFQKRKAKFNNNANNRFKQQRADTGFNSNTIRKGDVTIIQMPVGMQRAKSNKTFFDKKRQEYLWTIEWVTLDSEGKKVLSAIETKVPESTTIQAHLQSHKEIVCPIVGNAEQPTYHAFLQRIFLEKEQRKYRNSTLIRIDNLTSLKELLKNRTVLEFPTIYLAPSDQLDRFNIIDFDHDSGSSGSGSSDSDSSSSDDSSDDVLSDDEKADDTKTIGPAANSVEVQKVENALVNGLSHSARESEPAEEAAKSFLPQRLPLYLPQHLPQPFDKLPDEMRQGATQGSKNQTSSSTATPIISLGYASDSQTDDESDNGGPEEESAKI